MADPTYADDVVTTDLLSWVRWTCDLCGTTAVSEHPDEDVALAVAYEHARDAHGLTTAPEDDVEPYEPEPTPYVILSYYYTDASERLNRSIRRWAVHLPTCGAVTSARLARDDASRWAPAPDINASSARQVADRLARDAGQPRPIASACGRCLPDGVPEAATSRRSE